MSHATERMTRKQRIEYWHKMVDRHGGKAAVSVLLEMLDAANGIKRLRDGNPAALETPGASEWTDGPAPVAASGTGGR